MHILSRMVNNQERSNNKSTNEIEKLKGSSTSSTVNAELSTNCKSVGSSSATTSASSQLSSTLKSSSPISPTQFPSSAATPVKPLSSSTNFAKNASTQAATAGTQIYHKLIPIQSVLQTADHQHYNQQHHHTHHNSSLNHSSVSLQLQQSGATSHLNAHNSSTLQQFLGVNTNTSTSAIAHANLPSELPQEDEERLEKLFNQLDRDGNGRIDIHDLSEALREFGLSSVYAEVSEYLINTCISMYFNMCMVYVCMCVRNSTDQLFLRRQNDREHLFTRQTDNVNFSNIHTYVHT